METQPKYDAGLIHGYTDQEGFRGDFDMRNKMQASATSQLYKDGRIGKVVIAGGHYWGENKPTFAETMQTRLISKGINPKDIIARPETTTTNAEIDVFLEEAHNHGWESLVSISNRSHTPRVENGYKKRERTDVEQIKAESVLGGIKSGNRYPYREFLSKFRSSWTEVKFNFREIFIARPIQYLISDEHQIQFSNSRIIQKGKSLLDG